MATITQSLQTWWQGILADAPALIWVLIQMILILIGAKLVTSFSSRAIDRAFNNRMVAGGRAETLATLTASGVRYAIYFIAIAWILSVLGLSSSATSLLAGAGLGGLIIGLGAQDLFKDILTGFFLLFENQFAVGDMVVIGGITGVVRSISLRTTVLRSHDGVVHTLPNRSIDRVSNLSRDSSLAVVEMRLAHGQDVEAALSALQQVCDEVAQQFAEQVEEPPLAVGPTQADEWGVSVRMVCRTKPLQHYAVDRALRLAGIKKLNEEGILLAQATVAMRVQ